MDYTSRLKKNLKLYYIVNFLVGSIFIIPTWVAFHLRILNFAEIGLLHAYLYALQLVLELPTGALGDLLGRKKTIFLGWLLQALGSAYLAFAGDFQSFFIGYTVVAFGIALVSGSDTALLYDTHKELDEEEGFSKYIAKVSFVYRMGLAFGSFIGGYLYAISVQLPYLVMASFELLAVIFILMLIEPKIDSEKFSAKNYIQQIKDGFGQIWKNSYMKRLTVFYLLAGGVSWVCADYLNQPFAKDLGYSEIEQSWLFGSIYIGTSLLVLYLASSKNLITRPRVYIAIPIILSIALLPGVFATKAIVPLLLFLTIFSTSARFAFLDRFTNEEFESKYRATSISALNMLVGLFYILVVFAGGFIQDVYKTPGIFTALGLVALFIMFPIGVNLAKHKQEVKDIS